MLGLTSKFPVCVVCLPLKVAVHLGMMEDARKLYVAAERFDLLNKLYQVSQRQEPFFRLGEWVEKGRLGRGWE